MKSPGILPLLSRYSETEMSKQNRLNNSSKEMKKKELTSCLVRSFWPSLTIFWYGKKNLKMICKNDIRMVWLCWFWGSMNGWDLKILYRDLESWKKWLKKMKWNGIVWRIWKVEKNEKWEWNGMGEMGFPNKGLINSKEWGVAKFCFHFGSTH